MTLSCTLVGDFSTGQLLQELESSVAGLHLVLLGPHRVLSDAEPTSVMVELRFRGDDSAAMTSASALEPIRQTIQHFASERRLDFALQREPCWHQGPGIMLTDVDSTLIQAEVIDELARVHGVSSEVVRLTCNAMSGHQPFAESLRIRVSLLKGLSSSCFSQVAENLSLTPGADTLLRVLKRRGFFLAVASGGFSFATDRLRQRLGLDEAVANQLEIIDGVLTGRVLPPIVGPEEKRQTLLRIIRTTTIPRSRTLAIGDGANDCLMLREAALGVAFRAKPKVREEAWACIDHGGLDRALYMLGITKREIESV